ncbi:hypothetical protein ACFL6Y_11910 [Elusimicrobiota bacterium]
MKIAILITAVFAMSCSLFCAKTFARGDRQKVPIDLSDQWGHPSENQSVFGFCHAFATVGLVEAAYYREHKKHIDFSEKGLISHLYTGLSVDTITPQVRKVLKKLEDVAGEIEKEDDEKNVKTFNIGHGTDLASDFELMQERGLCEEAVYPYWRFGQDAMDTRNITYLGRLKRAYALAQVKPRPIDIQQAYNELFFPPRDFIRCRDEAKIRVEEFKGLELDYKICHIHNGYCKKEIIKQLRRGLPVAVNVKTYPAWREEEGGHLLIIDGYDPDNKRSDHFMDLFNVRNSWTTRWDLSITQAQMDIVRLMYVVYYK